MAAPYGNKNFQDGRVWRSAINQALEKRGAGDRMAALRAIADKLLDQAEAGDMAALKELGDRVDGKPAQSVDIGNADGKPFLQAIEHRIVDPVDPHPKGV
jgi:hypothetical protein